MPLYTYFLTFTLKKIFIFQVFFQLWFARNPYIYRLSFCLFSIEIERITKNIRYQNSTKRNTHTNTRAHANTHCLSFVRVSKSHRYGTNEIIQLKIEMYSKNTKYEIFRLIKKRENYVINLSLSFQRYRYNQIDLLVFE